MPKTIISDASCLILLDKIVAIEILNKLFGTIITTSEVAKEFGSPLPSWFKIQQPSDKNYQATVQHRLLKGTMCRIAPHGPLRETMLDQNYWHAWNYSRCKTCWHNNIS